MKTGQMETFEHGGNPHKSLREGALQGDDWVDFSANINPLGLPGELKYAILQTAEEVEGYPDPESFEFVGAICGRLGVKPENVAVAGGASELFFLITRYIARQIAKNIAQGAGKPRALIVAPSYSDYERAARSEGLQIDYHELSPENNFTLNVEALAEKLRGDEVVFLGRPNNPTGTFVYRKDLENLIHKNPESFFVIDEAFLNFLSFDQDRDNPETNPGESLSGCILPNLFVVTSLTKMYSIAGLRVGFAVGPAGHIAGVKALQSSWPLSAIAQKTGALVMKNDSLYLTHAETTRKLVATERNFLFEKLRGISAIRVFPSSVNFILFKVLEDFRDKNNPGETLYDNMVTSGILLRPCKNFYGLDPSYYRVAVLDRPANEKLVRALEQYFAPVKTPGTGRAQKKKTPALAILGTGSNVGKSLLTAAFCRIFLNEGLRVYPFKAQNMSLNSAVTRDQMEISRAQYLQAQAARVEPDVRMNPVLLKPVGKLTSQVILLGKPIGNQGYRQYRENKETIVKTVHEAYDDLSANADLVIIEGAGSPVEMNLKDHDIVNMKMAEYAAAKVLLAGNIDFGGIYASLAGTLMLLSKKERQRVIGLIVNQFRGDESLFQEGRGLLEKITGKPVFGVIPYVEKLLLPDEDSMAFSARQNGTGAGGEISTLEIFAVRLPHMSNFTDFDPFFQQGEIRLTFLESPPSASTPAPDVLILPGSKNVMSDMAWLNETGLSNYIRHLRNNFETEIVGICGGFQMLGNQVRDPHSIESDRGEIGGLGLLDMTTGLASDKTLRRFSGKHLNSNLPISGYEIHHGITEGRERPVVESALKSADPGSTDIVGFISADRRVWGTYIHGLFDNDDFRRWFFNCLLAKKNLPPLENIVPYDIDSAIENFAAVVRQNVDMDKLRKALFG